MTLKNFTNQLNEHDKLGLIIKFRRPFIQKVFIEKYFFKKFGNNIKSYEDGKKIFETNSIAHMYFIYREVLNFKKKIKNIRNKKGVN